MAVVQSSASTLAWNRVADRRWCWSCTLIYPGRRSTGSPRPRSSRATSPPRCRRRSSSSPRSRRSSSCSPSACSMRGERDPAVYAKAPWWEKRVYDGGERFIKDGDGKIELFAVPRAASSTASIIAVTSTFLAVAMGTLTAYGFSRFKMPGEAGLAVLHPVDAHAAAGGGGDPDVPDVPRGRPGRHAHRPDHPVHRVQPVVLGLADEGLHRRDPEGVRGGGAGRRLHAHARRSSRSCCRRRRPASRRRPCSASSRPGTNTPSR